MTGPPPSIDGSGDGARLRAVLEEGVRRGLTGGVLDDHLAHAARFAEVIGEAPATVIDLGSGGGLPGLVLALRWPESRIVLLDAQAKRVRFLEEAVEALGWGARVEIAHGRAEDLGRQAAWRGSVPCVVARSFGPPAVVAECAAGFLAVGGRLIVSEPPGATGDRWDVDGLGVLGLAIGPHPPGFQVLEQVAPCPERYPRKAGIPAKRPLFGPRPGPPPTNP